MHQEDKQTYYLDLGIKYLSKNASKVEIKELEDWVTASQENKRQFMELKKSWALAGIADTKEDIKLEQNWKEVREKLFDSGKTIQLQTNKSRRRWLRIAAALFFIVAATWVYRSFEVEEKPILVQATDDIEDIQLPDGSMISLNRASSIEFITNNALDQRELKLQGDAFFEITRDEAHPFIIKTQKVEIEVLGTSFYVDSRELNDEIKVIVASGTVAVRANGEQSILEVNERAIFKKSDGQLTKESIIDPNILALKTKTLVFDNTRLEEVVEVLNRYYHSDIELESEELKNCELNSIFNNKSLDSVLKILEASFVMEIIREGTVITLTGQCE